MRYILVISIFLAFSPSWAKGGGDGSGGADVVIENGTVTLADKFGVRPKNPDAIPDGDSIELSKIFGPEVFEELKQIQWLARTIISKENSVTSLILNPEIKYFLVPSLPDIDECTRPVAYPWAPPGTSIARIACTAGEKTWIREDLVKALISQQPPLEHALLLVHEGFRRIEPELSDRTIFRLTAGLDGAMKHLKRQMAGENSLMSDDELKRYIEAVEVLSYRESFYSNSERKAWLKKFNFHPGGGIYVNASVCANSYLGLGTKVYGKIGCQVVIRGSYVTGDLTTGENVQIINSNLGGFHFTIGNNTVIRSSTFGCNPKPKMIIGPFSSVIPEVPEISIKHNTLIDGSTIKANNKIKIGSDVQVRNTYLYNFDWGWIEIRNKAIVENVDLTTKDGFIVKEAAQLKNLAGATFMTKSNVPIGEINSLDIAARADLNFQNRFLCANGTNNDFSAAMFAPTISEEKDLSEYCKK